MNDTPLVEMTHTYFIMTPGVDLSSYIVYGDGDMGVYIKFGDQSGERGEVGIRDAYRVHNPDIGVAAVMKFEQLGEPLGTRLKRFIGDTLRWPTKGDARSEWFSIVPANRAHDLFYVMLRWDGKTINPTNVGRLENDIRNNLGIGPKKAASVPEVTADDDP